MIDLHCHLLPGIDDGPPTMEASLEQARLHVAAGVETVVCTPHVSQSYGNTAESIAAGVVELQGALDEAGIALKVLPGAEVSLSRAIALSDDELTALHLGGSGWLLVEPPLGSDVPRLAQIIGGLQGRGHKVLVAHPERCAAFHHDHDLLAELVANGALVQITATSFTGQFGRTVERLARTMLDQDLVHVVASDAHDAVGRPPGLAGPLTEAKLEQLSPWSTQEVPAAMLAGTDIPPGPSIAAKGRRSFFRRR